MPCDKLISKSDKCCSVQNLFSKSHYTVTLNPTEPFVPDISSLKLLGAAGILSYAAARLAAKAGMIGYSRLLLVAVPVSGMPEMPRGFRVAPMSATELEKHSIDISPAVQRLRFAQGMTCLAAFNRKEELVGISWVGAGPFEEDAMPIRFHVPADAGWDAGLWIKPQFRMGRGFAALWAGTAQWLNAHDKNWSMSWIADYNLPSILSHKRMGAVTVGRVLTFRFFRWHYMAEGRPRLVRLNSGIASNVRLPHASSDPAYGSILA
jgi:hypothetical protein